jgi:outer membrane protein assembly factor BamA
VIVSAVDVQIAGSALKPAKLPIQSGDVFTETNYQNAEEVLRQSYANRGYAYVSTERHAEVNLDRRQVHIIYNVDTGPAAVFGESKVEGTDKVDPEIILRELTYKPGEVFSAAKITESQDKLLALDLFSVVRIAPQELPTKPPVVPMEILVKEKEPREINLGIGYGTEEQFRARIQRRREAIIDHGKILADRSER